MPEEETKQATEPLPESALQETLEKNTENLLYMSETDAPFTFFEAGTLQSEIPIEKQLLTFLNLSEETPVEIRSFEEFFEYLTTEQDWHEEEDKKIVKQFKTLKESLEENLTELTVIRIGEIDIAIYIAGKTATDTLAGLKTLAVET
jgi:hypothetical protein